MARYNADAMLYFAFGSNINLDQLNQVLTAHGVDPEDITHSELAQLPEYRLRTNYFSTTHAAGACNIEPDASHGVEGVLMTITPAIQELLRIKEGFPHRYGEIEVSVHTASTQASVRALTYMVTSAHRLDIDLPVTARYRGLILAGAKQFGFSPAYQSELRHRLRTAQNVTTRAIA